MTESPILSDRIGRVGAIKLDRPKPLNALNDTHEGMKALLERRTPVFTHH